MSSKLSKGMYDVFVANIFNLITSTVTTLVLPKYLSIDTYALLKSYQLYVNCTAILQLGYVDGMYLKYGGQNAKLIDVKEWNETVSTLRIFQLVFAVFGGCVAIRVQSSVLFLVSIVIMPISVTGLIKQFYQAVGEFRQYKLLMSINTILTFVSNMVILFIFNSDNGYLYLIVYDFIYIVVWLALEIQIKKKYKSRIISLVFDANRMINYIKSGILLTVGNYSSYILTTMDRWFIKILLDNLAFAQYSFAASLESFLTVAVTPVTITLYNFFCQEKDMYKIKRIRNMVLIFASVLISCAFGVKFIILTWLPDYVHSLNIIFILFASQIFYTLNKAIYVNMYKAAKKQKEYFKKLLLVIIAGFFLNIGIYSIYRSYISFAIGTLLSSMLWLVFSVKDFKEYNFVKKELLFIVSIVSMFLICGFFMNSILGLTVYLICDFLLVRLLLKKDAIFVLEILQEKLDFKRNKQN